MNTSRYLTASIVAGLFMFFYGFIANGVILMDYWTATANPGMMRPEGEEKLWAIGLSCVLQALALGWIFVKGYENKGIVEGVRFGVLVAWFVGALYLLFYAIQPMTAGPFLLSVATDSVMYIGAGAVLAALYKSKPASAAT